MPRQLRRPITYLITGGATSSTTSTGGVEFRALLRHVELAAGARVSLVQIREKDLNARALFELASRAAALTRGSETRVVVNDRADVARAAGCDGVHLTTRSLGAGAVRRAFGEDFLIGVSAHTPAEARGAKEGGADFAVFGPVFDTPSKRRYGPPVGLEGLGETARALSPFPVVALGGVDETNAVDCIDAGAEGIAGIRLFADGQNLARAVHLIEDSYARRLPTLL
ncbi:MAG TPA: thiamine phosphate synthase [Pyrinomonadaceae bacterium]|nr:thiamine phosphate synthase [Pyrinomonadaceae bacterium]